MPNEELMHLKPSIYHCRASKGIAKRIPDFDIDSGIFKKDAGDKFLLPMTAAVLHLYKILIFECVVLYLWISLGKFIFYITAKKTESI